MQKQWLELVEIIRKPKIILVMLLIIGVMINGGLYFYGIMPQFLVKHNLTSQYNQLEKQRIKLEKLPIPPQIAAEDIEQLVQQVPLSVDSARFIINLREVELHSGVEIVSLADSVSVKKENQDSELINSQGKANINATYDSKKPSPSPTDKQTSRSSTANPINFTEQNMNLTIKGTYSQLFNFIKEIGQQKRLVKMKEWSFKSIASGNTTSINEMNNESIDISGIFQSSTANNSKQSQMDLTLTYYSVEQYAEKFPDLQPIPILEEPAYRMDPTISDEQYYELLKEATRGGSSE